MSDESVMKEKDNSSFENTFEEEYQKAKKEGFTGTKEEYKAIRDYT